MTYSLGSLGVLLDHNHLLTGQETSKAAVERFISLVDVWSTAVPLDTSGAREELHHKFLVAAHLKIDVAIANFGGATCDATTLPVTKGD